MATTSSQFQEAGMASSRYSGFLKSGLIGSTLVGACVLTLGNGRIARAADEGPAMRLPTGQFVTPTAPPDARQQFLNPGLANYPEFVANEAVRSQLSPDGATLLVLCAGYNNNLDQNAQNDLAASNQYIFVYNVAGKNQSKPA